MNQGYPDALLCQIGRVATISAFIEQEIVLHASAMAAQHTGGSASENLRLPFTQLRKRWYQLARQNLSPEMMTGYVEPVNLQISQAWPMRGHIIHGRWHVLAPDHFQVKWWEQKNDLLEYSADYTLHELTEYADDLANLLTRIRQFHDAP